MPTRFTVPTTFWGRVACIVFALFGIPLLLVTIADMGKFLSEFLSMLYKQYRRLMKHVRKLILEPTLWASLKVAKDHDHQFVKFIRFCSPH